MQRSCRPPDQTSEHYRCEAGIKDGHCFCVYLARGSLPSPTYRVARRIKGEERAARRTESHPGTIGVDVQFSTRLYRWRLVILVSYIGPSGSHRRSGQVRVDNASSVYAPWVCVSLQGWSGARTAWRCAEAVFTPASRGWDVRSRRCSFVFPSYAVQVD